jgi:YD repeat-containing protein
MLLTSETLPRGNGTTYLYDTQGNPTVVRVKADMSLADDDSRDLVIRFTYNERGQILTVQYPNGTLVKNTYDTRGNLVRRDTTADGDTLAETFSYDANGHLTTLTDAR